MTTSLVAHFPHLRRLPRYSVGTFRPVAQTGQSSATRRGTTMATVDGRAPAGAIPVIAATTASEKLAQVGYRAEGSRLSARPIAADSAAGSSGRKRLRGGGSVVVC